MSWIRIALTSQEFHSRTFHRSQPQEFTAQLPVKSLNGAFIQGFSRSGEPVYIQVLSRRFRPDYPLPVLITCIILMLLIPFLSSLLSAFLFTALAILLLLKFQYSWHFIRYFLMILSFGSAVLLLYAISQCFYSGFNPDTVKTSMIISGINGGLILCFIYWHLSHVKMTYGIEQPIRFKAYYLLSLSERFVFILTRPAISLTLSFFLILSVAHIIVQHSLTPFLRAEIAQVLNDPVVAYDLLNQAGFNSSQDIPESIMKRRIGEVLSDSIPWLSRRGFYPEAIALAYRSPEFLPFLTLAQREQIAAATVVSADEILMKSSSQDSFTTSTHLYNFIIRKFPETLASQQMVERSEWLIYKVRFLRTVDKVMGYKVPVDLRQTVEDSMVWHYSKPGQIYLQAGVTLVHLGKNTQALLSSMPRLLLSSGQSISCMGFENDSGISKLLTVPNITIGPDLLDTILIFEIPSDTTHAHLKLSGDSWKRLDLSKAAGVLESDF